VLVCALARVCVYIVVFTCRRFIDIESRPCNTTLAPGAPAAYARARARRPKYLDCDCIELLGTSTSLLCFHNNDSYKSSPLKCVFGCVYLYIPFSRWRDTVRYSEIQLDTAEYSKIYSDTASWIQSEIQWDLVDLRHNNNNG